MTYLIIIILLLYCIFKYDIHQDKKNKWNWYRFIMFLLILISGLGYRMGGDGMAYLAQYKNYSIDDGFGWDALTCYPNRMPGWVLLVKICKCITEDYWLFKLVHATILNVLIFASIKRITNMVFTTLLFYFVLIYFDINFQILRQAISMGLFLYSMRYIQNKNWLKYYFCIILAISFHEGVVICLLFPLFLRVKFDKKSIIIFISIVVLISIFGETIVMFLIERMVPDMLANKTTYYANDIDSGGGVLIFNLCLSVVIPAMYVYISRNENEIKSVKIGALVYGVIYVMNYFFPILYRFSYYYQLFFYIIYIELFYRIALNKGFKVKFAKVNNRILLYSKEARLKYIILIILFIIIRARMYFLPYGETGMPTWVQYYPYSSVLFEEPDINREKFIKHLDID